MSHLLESTLSQLFHYFAYRLERPRTLLEKAMFIVSVDVDVGSSKVGTINRGENDTNVNDRFSEYVIGEMEEKALPLIVDFFDTFDVPVTFGIRGQLLDVDTSILDCMLESPVQHDIGSHGFYHRSFARLSYTEAESELDQVSGAMRKLGIIPKSFIFPRGKVGHLELLEKFGYKCYRGYGDFLNDGMYIEKHGELYDVHPGLYIGTSTNARLIKRIIKIAIRNRLPFHMWFHPWNLGKEIESMKRRINRLLYPIVEFAKCKEKENLLEFRTMLSAAEEMESLQLERSG